MKKIRVLHILDELNTGGAEQIIYSYWKNMNRELFQWDFVVMNIPGKPEGRLEKPVIELGAKIYKVTKKQDSILKNIKEIDEIIKNGNYDIVHSHLYEISAFYLFSAWRYKVPGRIAHSHAAGEKRGWKIDLLRVMLKPILFFVSNGKAACGRLAAYSLWGKKIGVNAKIINNAIDVDKFRFHDYYRTEIRNNLCIDTKTTVIGTVGRLCFQKNSEFVIDIFHEYKKRNDNSKLILVGEGEDINKVMTKIYSYKLENDVFLLGRRNDINKIMSAMDYFVLPSRYEGLPLVMVEAQCSGLKCFMSDTITDEICLSENVKMLSIQSDVSLWGNTIFETKRSTYEDRLKGADIVRKAGYEITEQAEALSSYYKKLLNCYGIRGMDDETNHKQV